MRTRPEFIRHWRDMEGTVDAHYPDSDELLAIGAPQGRLPGLTRIGIRHERLPPGRRTSYPHAESAEEEFVFVLEGRPGVGIEGTLHFLEPGAAVGFPAGTGICHTFLKNADAEVRLMVIGEKAKAENRIYYLMNQTYEKTRKDAWADVTPRMWGGQGGKVRAGTG